MQKIELKNRKNERIVGELEKPSGKIIGTCIVQHGWGGEQKKIYGAGNEKCFFGKRFSNI